MMKALVTKRILPLLLVATLLFGFAVPVQAAHSHDRVTVEQVDNSSVTASLLTAIPENESPMQPYADTDVVRVSIVLEERSTIGVGFSTQNIAQNAEAMAYRADLQDQQGAIAAAIEGKTGQKLDVVWNLTLAANLISANVRYSQIEAIEQVPGVAEVLIETRYEPDVVSKEEVANPNMATSGKQIGSALAWNAGYTGAGSRIAIIDTGADVNHQSFNADAFDYALSVLAQENGMFTEAYLEKLDLLDADEISAVAGELNVSVNANTAYVNTKIPFGYNYVDGDSLMWKTPFWCLPTVL